MEKNYLWLVHNNIASDVNISEAQIKEIELPVLSLELQGRYHSFVIDRKDTADFLQKIKTVLPCACKAYEFSDEGMLKGEHYIDPSNDVHVFVPWLAVQTSTPPTVEGYDYFFFADFNATFEATDSILKEYLQPTDCRFDVLSCAKTEPTFLTGDNYYASKLKVQMHYADVLLVLGLLFKMVVENHKTEDEGSMTLLYGQFCDGRLRVFDRWCIANIWELSHDASFGHEMPLFCQWEFEQAVRKGTET